MKKNKTKIDAELYSIFSELYREEETRQQAIAESKQAFSIVKQDALFRTIPIKGNE